MPARELQKNMHTSYLCCWDVCSVKHILHWFQTYGSFEVVHFYSFDFIVNEVRRSLFFALVPLEQGKYEMTLVIKCGLPGTCKITMCAYVDQLTVLFLPHFGIPCWINYSNSKQTCLEHCGIKIGLASVLHTLCCAGL